MRAYFRKLVGVLSMPGWILFLWGWIGHLSTFDFLVEKGSGPVSSLIQWGQQHDWIYTVLGLLWLTALVVWPRRKVHCRTAGTGVGVSAIASNHVVPKPQPRVYWDGLFEAATSKKMTLQTSEDVMVHVTRGTDSSLAPILDQSTNRSNWGPISRNVCAIPFQPKGERYPDTLILIEVEIPDETTLKCPLPKREIRLRWEDASKEALFQVIPYIEGHHRFHVTLSVDEEYLTTASLSSSQTYLKFLDHVDEERRSVG